jgi:hypothetical protein
MGIEQEGTLSFRIRHQDPDWATNGKPYEFPPVEAGTISARVVKHPTGRIEIRLVGALGAEMVFDGTLPPVRPEGLTVTITWSPKEVRLFLDGRMFKSVQFTEAGGTGAQGGNGGQGGTAAPGIAESPEPDA